ncbi:hypothetical protein E2C01_053913 [Portunus trituberculatus]|uniref:Uncharacterized protein n=1 Tax=Portunus trituberculatus TaxID=210409 RepID=A0A5B7GTK4_PORTR|nr:hypothetical protein [Portunus trituberculatus]
MLYWNYCPPLTPSNDVLAAPPQGGRGACFVPMVLNASFVCVTRTLTAATQCLPGVIPQCLPACASPSVPHDLTLNAAA